MYFTYFLIFWLYLNGLVSLFNMTFRFSFLDTIIKCNFNSLLCLLFKILESNLLLILYERKY